MKNTFFKVFALVLLGSVLITACKKDQVRPDPTLAFESTAGYIYKDTTVASGATLPIGLKCKWNGVDKLQRISIYFNNQYPNQYEIPDSLKKEGTLNLNLFKSSSDQDTWAFQIIDENGQSASAVLIIKKDKLGGAITELKNTTLGAQSNPGIGSFFSLNNSVFSTTNAAGNQNIVDFVFGFDDTNKSYLASPSANLGTAFDLSSWTVKNTTMYCKTKKTSLQYDYVDSDIILKSEFVAASQNEKAAGLAAGDVYSFKSRNNKYGLIRINSVTTNNTGYVNFDIKMQK